MSSLRSSAVRLSVLLACVASPACAPDPMPLPAEAAAAVERAVEPPLYRKLYDYAFLPEVQHREQRVRLLVWLRYVGFNRYQLDLLEELAAKVAREREEVAAAQAALVAEHEPAVGAVYDRLWEAMLAGAPDPDLVAIGNELDGVRLREADLLELRARSVRTVFELEQPLLRTLTPQQEAMIADATFLLRHRLDPYANPGDFQALVGTVWTAGEYGVLSKPTFDPGEDHLDVGGLWSAADEERAPFPDVRREVVIYMVALEPALPEAIAAAKELRAKAGVAEPPAPGAGGQPGAAGMPVAVPGEHAPGVPTPPAPGIPEPPAPAPAGAPHP
ncbi:MAG: hypothetical protein ACOZNI_01630 [Myxococcota bacterium]